MWRNRLQTSDGKQNPEAPGYMEVPLLMYARLCLWPRTQLAHMERSPGSLAGLTVLSQLATDCI